jgi:uncharacterized protein (TIGR02118 family)
MLKVISLMRRAEGMSKAEFLKWVKDDHLEYAKEIPGLREYKVCLTAQDAETPYDCANELYFDDEEARVAAFASDAGKAAGADAAAHTSERVHLLTTEHQQF